MRFLYRYHTNWYRYRNAIFAGFKRNFDLDARERSSLGSHFEITNVNCIQAHVKEKLRELVF